MYIYIGILFAILFFFVFAIILPLLPEGRIFLYNQLGREDTTFGNFFGELQEAVEEGDFKTGNIGLLAIAILLIWSILVCMVSLLIIGIYPIVILYGLIILIINKQIDFEK